MTDFPIQPLEASVLTERSFKSVNGDALCKALDVMLLGSTSQANRIIAHLYHYNVLNLKDYEVQTAGLHFGWAQSKQWPRCLSDPDPAKPLIGRPDTDYGDSAEVLRALEEKCRSNWDEGLRNKYPRFGMEDLNNAIATMNEQLIQDKPMSTRFWRLGQAIEIALILKEQSTAEDLLRKYIPDFTGVRDLSYEHGQLIFGGRHVWDLLGNGFLAKELHVSEEAIAKYVDSVLEMLTLRFENGPCRPCKDKSIKELIDLLDKTWLEIKPLEPDQSALVDCSNPVIPETFTHKGLSEQEIADMEKRLDTELPADFKEFLSLTNGPYQGPIMTIPEHLMTCSRLITHDLGPRIRTARTSVVGRIVIGTDEAQQLLVEPQLVKEAIAEFDRKYESADEGTKRVSERAATDFYGGLKVLRSMAWMVSVTYHWDTVFHVYGSFRKLLEGLVLQAQQRLEKAKQDAQNPERTEEIRGYKEGLKRKRESDDDDDEDADENDGEEEDEVGSEIDGDDEEERGEEEENNK